MSRPAFAKARGRAPNITIPKTMSGSIRIVKKQGWGTRLERYGVTIWRRAWRTRMARMIPLMLFFACLGWYFNRPIPDSSAYPLGDIDQLFLLATCEWERGSLVHQPQNFFQRSWLLRNGRKPVLLRPSVRHATDLHALGPDVRAST